MEQNLFYAGTGVSICFMQFVLYIFPRAGFNPLIPFG